MDIIEFRDYCLSFPHVQECMPFGDDVLVFKIGGKMFAYAGLDDFRFFNVKCSPEHASDLRERYPEIVAGFHANKRHWNSVYVDGSLPESFIRRQISDSYNLVLESLPLSVRKSLEAEDSGR